MQIRNDRYIFTLDKLSPKRCSGWYMRLDNADDFLLLETDGRVHALRPDIERPDVLAAGYPQARCGFEFAFIQPLSAGMGAVFKSASGELILSAAPEDAGYIPDALNSRMIRMVEPFVEMDIAKVRAALTGNIIYDRYKKMFAAILASKKNDELTNEIVEILADMKTTMHLLCAAYLDAARYKDPEFLESLPKFCPDTTSSFVIDMRGDITGSNWSEPDANGRWLGTDSAASIFLPNPGPGEYALALRLGGERGAGIAEKLRLAINDKETPLAGNSGAFPRAPECRFALNDDLFVALRVWIDSQPDNIDGHDESILFENLTFTRLPQ